MTTERGSEDRSRVIEVHNIGYVLSITGRQYSSQDTGGRSLLLSRSAPSREYEFTH